MELISGKVYIAKAKSDKRFFTYLALKTIDGFMMWRTDGHGTIVASDQLTFADEERFYGLF